MSQNTLPVIAGISIRLNDAGLYNLNDLHKAAGGESRHQVSKWMDNEKTKEYIASEAARDETVPVFDIVRGGSAPGTYVSRMLAYDYAAWVSSDFKGQVYRVFDAVLAGDHALADDEARKAVAMWEQRKKDGMPAKDCDYMIAKVTGRLEEFKAAELAEQEARANTVEGFVETEFAKVYAGYQKTVRVPDQFDVEAVKAEIERFMGTRDAICRFDYVDRRTLQVDTV